MRWSGPTFFFQFNDNLTVEDNVIEEHQGGKPHEYLVRKGEQFYLPMTEGFRVRIDEGPEPDMVWVRWWT